MLEKFYGVSVSSYYPENINLKTFLKLFVWIVLKTFVTLARVVLMGSIDRG